MQDLVLLNKNTVIAYIRNGLVEPVLQERLPLFLQRTGDIEAWLSMRAIDSHRTNSRLIKKALRLESKDDITTVLYVNGVTITDNYWVRPIDSALTYDDVRFKANLFDKLALRGDVNSFQQPPSRTPELTNIGSFEKCWRLESHRWFMVKTGNTQERFSEMFAYYLGVFLGFPMASYELTGEYIKTPDFTENARFDFEPAIGVIGDESDYIKIYRELSKVSARAAKEYVSMCYLDALIFNMDRHEFNFGLLRDSDTGEILSLAPFFDHNIALISRGYPKNIESRNDRFIEDFAELLRATETPFRAKRITESILKEIVSKISLDLPKTEEVQNPRQFVIRYVMNKQERLREACGELLRLIPEKSEGLER